MKVVAVSNLFKSVGDPARLRLLHLLTRQELSVGELVRVLGLPQSTVSRHLKTLREQGLVADRAEGVATYCHATLEAELANGDTPLREALRTMLADSPLPPADQRRLERVLALRERAGEDFFDRLGHRWDALRESCFGPSVHFEALLHLLPREWTVADIGTGTGYLLPYLGAQFARVVAIDQSEQMLALARRRVGEKELANVETRAGDITQLPVADGELDLALVLLLLHHVGPLPRALGELARALKPGGKVLIAELHPYENEKFRVHMGDRRPGIAREELLAAMAESGLHAEHTWDFPHEDRPEHELAPLPRMYGVVGEKG